MSFCISFERKSLPICCCCCFYFFGCDYRLFKFAHCSSCLIDTAGSIFGSQKLALAGAGNNPFAVRSPPGASATASRSSENGENSPTSCIIAPSKFGAVPIASLSSPTPLLPTAPLSSCPSPFSNAFVKEGAYLVVKLNRRVLGGRISRAATTFFLLLLVGRHSSSKLY